MSEFKEGLYDQLVTRHVRESLDRQATLGLKSSVEALEESDCPDYLARHLIRQIKSALRGVSSEDRKQRQIELANSLLDFVRTREDLTEPDPVDPPGEVLRAIYRGPTVPEPPSEGSQDSSGFEIPQLHCVVSRRRDRARCPSGVTATALIQSVWPARVRSWARSPVPRPSVSDPATPINRGQLYGDATGVAMDVVNSYNYNPEFWTLRDITMMTG